MLNPEFWRGRSVVVTGHTGFKGAWLCLWLERMGARVSGFALAPDAISSPYELLRPALASEHIGDIRESRPIAAFLRQAEPEIVIHMAAQPLVRLSYAQPVETFSTNIMGTVHLLEAVRACPSVRAAVIVTTDKVYENKEHGLAFREEDPLGGHDPYSSSKAGTEIVTASYRASFFGAPGAARIASARAGNVVGGGDWSADRLIPDLVRALGAKAPICLRYPRSVRPWLHVLEPLSGYLALAEKLVEAPEAAPDALNFAPDPAQSYTVADVVERFGDEFDGKPGWIQANGDHPREAALLMLDPALAALQLGWRARLDFDATIRWTAEWYRDHMAGADMRGRTVGQIERYAALIAAQGETLSA
ncbi:CDP-glucose 4,6-dehydratase [Bosea sp. R86505]|uniref:CDP-glucose 4,6-dehydratase n=1 Tax=Bosea sp. R86505 TaxID=3101710 RepID=UPI00367313BD